MKRQIQTPTRVKRSPVVDQRIGSDIQVSWQLAVVVVGLFVIPLSLLPFYIAINDAKPLPQIVWIICPLITLAMMGVMGLAVRSRLRQVEGETRADGKSLYKSLALQILSGVGLCLLAVVLLLVLQWEGFSVRTCFKTCILFAAGGVLLIGRAMVPTK